MGQVGRGAIETILQNLTRNEWVTVHARDLPVDPNPDARPAAPLDWRPISLEDERLPPAATDDMVWASTTKNQRLRYWFTVTDVCRYFSARNPVDTILPPEENGYGLARWRHERTASVKLYRDTNSWADFGAQVDGKHDGGDALELYCRVSGRAKRDLLKETAKAMRVAADNELDRAAREQRGPARWVADIMSPKAWAHFDRQFTRHT